MNEFGLSFKFRFKSNVVFHRIERIALNNGWTAKMLNTDNFLVYPQIWDFESPIIGLSNSGTLQAQASEMIREILSYNCEFGIEEEAEADEGECDTDECCGGHCHTEE